MKHLKHFENMYHKDNFNRTSDEFKVGDYVICVDPYKHSDDILKIEKFEKLKVIGVDLDYGYILIENDKGQSEPYFINRLMPEAEFYANKYNL